MKKVKLFEEFTQQEKTFSDMGLYSKEEIIKDKVIDIFQNNDFVGSTKEIKKILKSLNSFEKDGNELMMKIIKMWSDEYDEILANLNQEEKNKLVDKVTK